MFYINYEECKSDKLEAGSVTADSFILTMRNVNADNTFSNGSLKTCFILTMRNVNGKNTLKVVRSVHVLY